MKSTLFSLFALVFLLSSISAFAAEPADYYRAGLIESGIPVTDVRVIPTLNIVVPSSKVLVYLDELAQHFGSDRPAWRFDKIAFVSDGNIHICIGGISRMISLNENQRLVNIAECDVSYITAWKLGFATEIVNRVVTLPAAQ